MKKQLQIIMIGTYKYYLDTNYGELRNIKNPHDCLCFNKYVSIEDNIRNFKILDVLRKKDKKVWWFEKFHYENESLCQIFMMDENDKIILNDEQIADKIINWYSENTIIQELPSEYKNYNYEKENGKICPVCSKKLIFQKDEFFHDKILNVWICEGHKLSEIESEIELKDSELIEHIKAKEQGKLTIFVPKNYDDYYGE
jgi:hypothetical protein